MARIAAAVAVLMLTSCGYLSNDVRVALDEPFPKKLSGWRLFKGALRAMQPNEGVIPYDLNTPLFSDYAAKSRVVWMPKGSRAQYRETAAFEFPEGAIIAKTFAFGARIIETRILVNTRKGWVGLPYVWNQEQTEATFEVAPDPVRVSHDGQEFNYVIPNTNQCKGCHERAKRMLPIGIAARHLNKDYEYATGRENQMVHWTKAGYLSGAPLPAEAARNAVWNEVSTGTLEQRALAYLDVNCGHCHNPQGPADTSGLFLEAGQTDPLRLGFCKVPVAAGHGAGNLRFDVVHGLPDESILPRRMNSVEPKVAMPELGRATIHKEGVALIREWIASTRGSCEKQ